MRPSLGVALAIGVVLASLVFWAVRSPNLTDLAGLGPAGPPVLNGGGGGAATGDGGAVPSRHSSRVSVAGPTAVEVGEGEIAGRVVDGAGDPLVGVLISIFRGSNEEVRNDGDSPVLAASTDHEGIFQVSCADRNRVLLVAEAPGYEEFSTECRVSEFVEIVLASRRRVLRVVGRVQGKGGSPLSEFELRAYYMGREDLFLHPWTGFVGLDGSFELELDVHRGYQGQIMVVGRAEGYIPGGSPIDSVGGSSALVIDLVPGVIAWGIVHNSDGGPIADVLVRAIYPGDRPGAGTRTKADGLFTLTLETGRQLDSLWIEPREYKEYAPRWLREDEMRGSWEGLSIEVMRGAEVSGFVLSQMDTPSEECTVRIWCDGALGPGLGRPPLWSSLVVSGIDGGFRFSGVPNVVCSVAAFSSGEGGAAMLCPPVRIDLTKDPGTDVLLHVGGQSRLKGTVEMGILSDVSLWLELRTRVPGRPDIVHSSVRGLVGSRFDLLGPKWAGDPVRVILRIALGDEQYVERWVVLDSKVTVLDPVVFEMSDLVEFDRLGRRFEAK